MLPAGSCYVGFTASPAKCLLSKHFPAFSGWIPLVSVLGRQRGFVRRAGEQACERVKGWGDTLGVVICGGGSRFVPRRLAEPVLRGTVQ